MKIAFGVKAHSGWAAVVVVGVLDGKFQVVDRQRIDLVDESWAKQPYHAAENLKPQMARALVERGVRSAHEAAERQLKLLTQREQGRNNQVMACAVLTGAPMPDWTVDEILAVHFRMHKAEGVLFRDAFLQAAQACKLRPVALPEKALLSEAQTRLALSEKSVNKQIAMLGKSIGPPWAKDQRDAALAAMIALVDSKFDALSEK